ncbi:hypothetical protein ACU686_37295 [Yinghuangia aomiensis]
MSQEPRPPRRARPTRWRCCATASRRRAAPIGSRRCGPDSASSAPISTSTSRPRKAPTGSTTRSASDPRLACTATRLRREHGRLSAIVDELSADAAHEPVDPGWHHLGLTADPRPGPAVGLAPTAGHAAGLRLDLAGYRGQD